MYYISHTIKHKCLKYEVKSYTYSKWWDLLIRKHASKTLDANISGVFFFHFIFFKCIYLLNYYINLYTIF